MPASDGFTMKNRPFLDRFWRLVDVGDPDECWEWRGARRRREVAGRLWDYGLWSVGTPGGRITSMRAHRFSWEIHNQIPIPEGMVVLHSCDNPPCVNPAHLSIGTVADNQADMVSKNRQKDAGRTRCDAGHDWTEPGVLTYVRKNGRMERVCIPCRKVRQQRWLQKQRNRAA